MNPFLLTLIRITILLLFTLPFGGPMQVHPIYWLIYITFESLITETRINNLTRDYRIIYNYLITHHPSISKDS
jgi:hypothetical protein